MDAYSRILKIFESTNMKEDTAFIGEVISLNPLKIQLGDLVIDRDNMLIEYDLDYRNKLNYKDKVLLISIDNNQLFVVVCKVV